MPSTDRYTRIGALFSVKGISPDTKIQDAARAYMTITANEYLAYMDQKLAVGGYFMGKQFTAADAYAFVVTGWTQWLEIPLTPYKNVQTYRTRIAARPAVAKVLKEEGLS